MAQNRLIDMTQINIIWYISLDQSIILVTKELVQFYQAQLPLLRTSSSVVENMTILEITRCFSSYPVCSCVCPVKAIGAAIHVGSVLASLRKPRERGCLAWNDKDSPFISTPALHKICSWKDDNQSEAVPKCSQFLINPCDGLRRQATNSTQAPSPPLICNSHQLSTRYWIQDGCYWSCVRYFIFLYFSRWICSSFSSM